ncbi:hypothetical protein THAOC_21324 [Thalassiosira oceanica]|uniref:Uncharacterized protein n=1 Tax=Thalassiosira oceanica TaxID=159749 RepID=K0S1B4_THAOC|nr:hypothetical protein THAOC_21324 [Thalassiosira oceanica]|eukprot:EJK58544.1 hypothetical protein THAOC_21324 [Thalassiosira oceanica]
MIGCGLNAVIYQFAFHGCPLTDIKIVSGSLPDRVARLPEKCRLSVEGKIRELVTDNEIGQYTVDVQDTDNQTAESLHQVLRLTSFQELKESSILIELAMWKSSLVKDRARADCRTSVPDPAKSLIMEYYGFAGFLEPAIEGD